SVEAPAPRAAGPEEGQVTHPSAQAVMTWQRSLLAHLQRYKRYPPRAHGEQGIASVAFTLDQEGHLLSTRIVRSSGSAALGGEPLAITKRPPPPPRPPAGMTDAQLSFVVPIRYTTR